MQETAQKLTRRDASGKVTQWGVQVPSSGFPYWLFQGFTTPNGGILMNREGNQTSYDHPAVIEALQYWVDLSTRHKVHPPGVVEWGTTPRDFFEKKVAMMWTTTGNLTNVKANAKFDFGVAMLPASMNSTLLLPQACRMAPREPSAGNCQSGLLMKAAVVAPLPLTTATRGRCLAIASCGSAHQIVSPAI